MSAPENVVRRLQLVQGLHWLHSAQGDPYATLLCGADKDPWRLYRLVRSRGDLWQSTLGTHVSASYAVCAELLAHPGLTSGPLIELAEVVPGLDLAVDSATGNGFAGSASRHAGRVLAMQDGVFDLVAVTARVAADVLAESCAVDGAQLTQDSSAAAITADAMVCPQSYDAIRAAECAVDRLRAYVHEPMLPLAVFGVRRAADLTAAVVHIMLCNPPEWPRLVADPGRVGRVLAEGRRVLPPVQVRVLTADADIEIAGHRLAAGTRVAALLGGANLDPVVFTDPERFDLDRDTIPPLADGPAHTAVAPFADTVAAAVLNTLITRLPALRLAGPVQPRPWAPVTRGLLRLPVGTTQGEARSMGQHNADAVRRK